MGQIERYSKLKISRSILFIIFGLMLLSCSAQDDGQTTTIDDVTNGIVGVENPSSSPFPGLVLPQMDLIDLNGKKLSVVATTSIVGDIVSQVGGEAIDLIVLMEAGQDPHSYVPSAVDLTDLATANLIFINGWNLEEGLLDKIVNVAPNSPLIPVSAGIPPRYSDVNNSQHDLNSNPSEPGEQDFREDPHTWLNPHNVVQWVKNIEEVLSTSDPSNKDLYMNNANQLIDELEALINYYNDQVEKIPVQERKFVTSHDSFGYFADAFGFKVIGTVIPGGGTLAEPSANDLARLVEDMRSNEVCVIFTETSVNDQLSIALSLELEECANVSLIPLNTGTLGTEGSGISNYITMMRSNIDLIVGGLNQTNINNDDN